MLRTDELDYHLPPELVATHPASPRDSARLMVVSIRDATVRDRPGGPEARSLTVASLPEVLQPGDLLVFNATRVLRARLHGVRADTGGRVEGLYLGESPGGPGERRWQVLLRGKRMKAGIRVTLHLADGSEPGVSLLLLEPHGEEAGGWIARVEGAAEGVPTPEVLDRVGLTPLPPYILKARRDRHEAHADGEDRSSYQTVYARAELAGSVAAPTAGLHFTPGLLDALDRRGVVRTQVVLHVGTGTFRPVETPTIEAHPMHSEWCSMSAEAISAVLLARKEGRRVIAVGTTSARTLESVAATSPTFPATGRPVSLDTRILITPGYTWRWTDGLLTNFHLPRSTLMAMVAALLPGGAARLGELYARAVAERYRFYSYGDAMLLV